MVSEILVYTDLRMKKGHPPHHTTETKISKTLNAYYSFGKNVRSACISLFFWNER